MTERDPSPWLAFLGDELRRHRVRAGLSQDQLAKKIFCVRPTVSMIETGARMPTEAFVDACDEVFGTDGLFGRIRERAAAQSTVPNPGGEFLDVEARAVNIRAFQPVLVPGLLQTEGYVRALFAGGLLALLAGNSEQDFDDRVARRLRRQTILEPPNPTSYWVVLSEAVLRRMVGGAVVMRGQLQHLLTQARRRHINLQVMPFAVGAYPGAGPFTLLGMADGAVLAHPAGVVGDPMTADIAAVAECAEKFDILRSQAMSLDESVRMIESRLKELGDE